jgi:hypothetical protein
MKWLAVILLALKVLGFAPAPPAGIEFDATSGDFAGPNEQSVTFSHTLGSGSNRYLIVFSGMADNGIITNGVTSVTYDSVNLTNIAGASFINSNYDSLGTWWMDETDLTGIGAGAHNIVVTTTDTPDPSESDIIGMAVSMSGCEQGAPEVDEEFFQTSGGNGTIEDDVITATDGAWVLSAAVNGNAGDTGEADYGETLRQVFGASDEASYVCGTKVVPTTTTETTGYTFDSVHGRIGIVSVSVAPI